MAKIEPESALEDAVKQYHRPAFNAHKGQNGRLLVIGGSKLFHAAIIWAASAASRLIDHVHFASTTENNEVFVQLKAKFVDGIVVERDLILNYVDEDDCVLIGPGMRRGQVSDKVKDQKEMNFNDIIYLEQEWDLTYALVRHLLQNYPQQQYVLDAGALQVMEKQWLLNLEKPAILTPHIHEFKKVFGIDLEDKSDEEKMKAVYDTAKKYRCVIMLKNVVDYISDGDQLAKIEGGNPGLAKGGSGDVLSGITSALNTKNSAFHSCVLASYIVKTTAEHLKNERGLMYNSTDLVMEFAKVAHEILDGDQ